MKVKKPGLRILKTALAVFISLIVSSLRSDVAIPFYSAIASIICLKTDVDNTIKIGVNRVIGTLIGGFVALIYLLLARRINLSPYGNYFLVTLIMSGLIWLMSIFEKPNAIAIMAVVFLSITINHGQEAEFPVVFAFNRVVDTLIGVIVAIIVNWTDFKIRGKTNIKD